VTITAKYIETGKPWATWQIVMQADSDEPKSGTLSSFAYDEKALMTFVHDGESREYGWCLFRQSLLKVTPSEKKVHPSSLTLHISFEGILKRHCSMPSSD
jgi:hypothetical protein